MPQHVRAFFAVVILLAALLPTSADAQGGCCRELSGSCFDFTVPFPEAALECFPGTFFAPPATCTPTGCTVSAPPPALPPLPTEAQLNVRVASILPSGEPRPFFVADEPTPFELGINAVKGTAQLYRAVVILNGFALALPGTLQEAGRLEVRIGLVTTSFPLLVLDAATLFADLNGNGQWDGTEPTIAFRSGSIVMIVSVPFGGDGDAAIHDVQADARVTIRGAFLRPVTPGTHLVRAILTTVDPDTGGPDDGAGVAPRAMAIDRTVVIRAPLNQPPVCTAARANPAQLWPANHKLVPVTIAGVTDQDNDAVSLTVTGVTQDEPVNGLGDGDTSPDAVIQGTSVLLRAERSGKGNGRVYRVSFSAADARGGTCTGAVLVCVPHDQGKKAGCLDDGQQYRSTQP